MQGSVSRFDEQTRAGSVVLDDGQQRSFSGAVFSRSALRHVRVGQRVSLEVDETGAVSRLWIVGIGPGEPIV